MATGNHVQANYGDMKKWKQFLNFGRTSTNIGIIIPAIIQCDIIEIINSYTVLHFEISLMILTAMTYGDGRQFERSEGRRDGREFSVKYPAPHRALMLFICKDIQ
jgi:hypothetical protein